MKAEFLIENYKPIEGKGKLVAVFDVTLQVRWLRVATEFRICRHC